MSSTIYLVMGSAGEYDDHHEWVVKAFSDKTAAELHAQELLDDQTHLNSMIEQVCDFARKWQETNPCPEYPTHLLQKEKKWTGLRKRTRDHNEQVQMEYAKQYGQHCARLKEAKREFVTKYWKDSQHIDALVSAYVSQRKTDYIVQETEFD